MCVCMGEQSAVKTLMPSPNLGGAGVAEQCSRECGLCLAPRKGHLEIEEGSTHKEKQKEWKSCWGRAKKN